MSTYNQAGVKRQKVREGRSGDYGDYFQGIDKPDYRYYGAGAGGGGGGGRGPDDWLRLSVSLTDFRRDGSDKCGKPTYQRPWDDQTDTVENCKRCVKACFDFCLKLGVKYWTAFDSDITPSSDSYEDYLAHCDDICDFIQELVQRTHVRPLWIAPDLHSSPRYASGALTSGDLTTYTMAASQIKKCLEMSQRLNCECFLLWPMREGYDAIFTTDIAKEIKMFSKLLKMAADYKEKLGFKCQMLVMPYSDDDRGWDEEDNHKINRYMWDVTSCLFLLKSSGLERHYRVCSPPGHHMHMASVYNALGGVVLDDRDRSERQLVLMVKCFMDQSAPPAGGVNLRVRPGRGGRDARELLARWARAADGAARAARAALAPAEPALTKAVQQKYSSLLGGLGARAAAGDASLDECEEHYRKFQHTEPPGERPEHLAWLLQRRLQAEAP